MTELRKTPLHAAHVGLGAKLVDFGGWEMPLQYPQGILAEHHAVRSANGLFDVSHMGEIDFLGSRSLEVVQQIVTNDASKLIDGRAQYTVACYPSGGIVDDFIVYRLAADHYRIVVNATNTAKDYQFFREIAAGACDIVDRSDELALIAVQGPAAVTLVARLAGNSLASVLGFAFGTGEVAGVPVVAARTGYTGEDGFELFVSSARARPVWDSFIEAGAQPVGLGARDTLRLEAKLCLYGNDIDDTTNPLEAGLGWVVKLDKSSEFVGREALVQQHELGLRRKLVGFRVLDRGIARHGAHVQDSTGNVVGAVTSGSMGPTVKASIGLAYVPIAMSSPGQHIVLSQRGKTMTAEVVAGPFYKRPK